jgi:hypothetical protein
VQAGGDLPEVLRRVIAAFAWLIDTYAAVIPAAPFSADFAILANDWLARLWCECRAVSLANLSDARSACVNAR